jgi:hypothetical protein
MDLLVNEIEGIVTQFSKVRVEKIVATGCQPVSRFLCE